MSRKQITILLLALLLGTLFVHLIQAKDVQEIPAQQGVELLGPQRTEVGTLAVFEVVPAQNADWTITPEIDATSMRRHQVDTSTSRLYFATPNVGTYTIVAAIIVDGKPQILTQTVQNGNHDKINPQPVPPFVPTPTPLPPTPGQTLIEWLKTQRPLLVKSRNVELESRLVALCFVEIAEKIENGLIKTPQNARSQLQIVLTLQLANASPTAINDWLVFLAELSKKIETELGENIDDMTVLKNTFRTVAETLSKTDDKNDVKATAAEITNSANEIDHETNVANDSVSQKNNKVPYQRENVTRRR